MLHFNININYYEILGLEQTATPEQIKKHYKKKALIHHPDKGGDEEQFKKIAAAYEVLIDEPTKNQYDLERAYFSTQPTPDNNSYEPSDNTNSPKSTDAKSSEDFYRTASPFSVNSVVFNTVNTTNHSSNTSVVPSSGSKSTASDGFKAETMSVDELVNLANAVEQVALAIAKNIELLNKLYMKFFNYRLWDLAKKHPSVAYQILACKETRHYLYSGNYSHNIEHLLRQNYNLLLLIAGSDELTEQFLYLNGTSILNGTELHSIYQIHLKQRGSCSAFMALIESNPQFNVLFKNIQKIQSVTTQCELSDLQLLDCFELKKIAINNLSIATMVIKNSTLLDKFDGTYYQSYLIDILLAHPSLMDDFFTAPRTFHFDAKASLNIVFACKENSSFLSHIINSQESDHLNGFEIEELINGNIKVQEQIYQVELLKKRHEAYLEFAKQITSHNILSDAAHSNKIKEIYEPLLEQMNISGEFDLYLIVRHLAKSSDHKILAVNCTLIRDSYHFHQLSESYAAISESFFSALFDNKSLRATCYKHAESLCIDYFIAFECLISEPNALSHITDESLYKLQQHWILKEETKVRAIFNENPELMQRWGRGAQISKLHQGVLVSDYKERPGIQCEPESLIKIRSLINTVQERLTFSNMVFGEGDKTFITQLAEQKIVLSTITSSNVIDKNIISGVFWFLLLSNRPDLLDEELPLDFISEQIEVLLSDLSHGKMTEESWLIKDHKNKNDRSVYELNSVLDQEKIFYNLLLAHVDMNDKALWDYLLQDQTFINHVLDNTTHLKHLAVLNWKCPMPWVKQLTQDQLINVVIHLFSNYSELTLKEQLLDDFLPDVADINSLINQMPVLASEQRAELYLRLLNNGQLTLVDFLKVKEHIDLLRQCKSLQQYVIDYNTSQQKSDLYEVIDIYCRQKLMGDALAVFSLLHDATVEDNMYKLVPNYTELPAYSYQKMMIQGFACLTIGLTLGFVAPQLLLAASVVLIAYALYEVSVHITQTKITYREALSRNNSSQFFKPAPLKNDPQHHSDDERFNKNQNIFC